MTDKKDIIIELLKVENDGLYLAYGEINKRLKLQESENKELKKQLNEKQNEAEDEKFKRN